MYVKESFAASPIDGVTVPPEIEGEWLLIRHPKFPRSVPAIAVFAMYMAPDSPHVVLLYEHVASTMDFLLINKPHLGFTVIGDFNSFDVTPLCHGNNLKQIILAPTRNNATLDLVMTNFSTQYTEPSLLPPLGRSDHNCIQWVPRCTLKCGSTYTYKTVVRPMKDSIVLDSLGDGVRPKFGIILAI